MTILVQKPYKMGEVEFLQDWANIIVVLNGNSGLSERGRLRPRDFVTCGGGGIWNSRNGGREAAANEYRIHYHTLLYPHAQNLKFHRHTHSLATMKFRGGMIAQK